MVLDGNTSIFHVSHYRFYCTLIAAQRILYKITKICANTQQEIKVLYLCIKLFLYTLSAYTSGASNQETTNYITIWIRNVQTYLVEWLQKPDVDFGDQFGGKTGNKTKDEIKVCDYINCISKDSIIMFMT